MASLKSYFNHEGSYVSGILLGRGVARQEDGSYAQTEEEIVYYEWEDHRIPSGWIDEEGNIYAEEQDIEENQEG